MPALVLFCMWLRLLRNNACFYENARIPPTKRQTCETQYENNQTHDTKSDGKPTAKREAKCEVKSVGTYEANSDTECAVKFRRELSKLLAALLPASHALAALVTKRFRQVRGREDKHVYLGIIDEDLSGPSRG